MKQFSYIEIMVECTWTLLVPDKLDISDMPHLTRACRVPAYTFSISMNTQHKIFRVGAFKRSYSYLSFKPITSVGRCMLASERIDLSWILDSEKWGCLQQQWVNKQNHFKSKTRLQIRLTQASLAKWSNPIDQLAYQDGYQVVIVQDAPAAVGCQEAGSDRWLFWQSGKRTAGHQDASHEQDASHCW